jgi:hypothetical protein
MYSQCSYGNIQTSLLHNAAFCFLIQGEHVLDLYNIFDIKFIFPTHIPVRILRREIVAKDVEHIRYNIRGVII